MVDLDLFPYLRTVRGGEQLPCPAEGTPKRLQTLAIELGIGIVEQVERVAPGFCDDPSVSRQQGQTESLALSGRRHPPQLMAVPADREVVAMRTEDRLSQSLLPVLRGRQLVGDRRSSFEAGASFRAPSSFRVPSR